MRQSRLFPKTLKTPPKEATSASHKFLVQGGYVDMLQAGVYSYLPLGWRVIQNICRIVRQEMDAEGGQELLMPALQAKDIWEETGRWSGSLSEVMYQFKDASGKDLGLAATHEEVIYDLVRKFANSYKDLPISVYQIQNKFRAELRAKGGLMRGREFMMKDMYSFHYEKRDLDAYYEHIKKAYLRVYSRLGLDAKIVEASGGVFTDNYSHEFQVISDAGEDKTVYCDSCSFAQNAEIAKAGAGDTCPLCGAVLKEGKSIEVGNIFNFGEKYAKDMNGYVNDDKGEKKPILMASYGIGISRLVASIAEIYHDDKGIIWPKSVAPFTVHLLSISQDAAAEAAYEKLSAAGIEVLFDDRDISAGQKFADADLLGLPYRVAISKRTVEISAASAEVKERGAENAAVMTLDEFIERAKQK